MFLCFCVFPPLCVEHINKFTYLLRPTHLLFCMQLLSQATNAAISLMKAETQLSKVGYEHFLSFLNID